MVPIALPKRAKVVGWGNLGLGLATPLRIGFHVASALQVFTYSWCGDSILLLAFLGSTLGILTGASGWGLLKQRPWTRRITCIAGGATLGYSAIGIFIMLVFGLRRELEVLIRHGSTNWWNWSISHFQSPIFIELPLAIWWIISLAVVFSLPQPRSRHGLLTQSLPGIGWVVGSAVLGGLSRWWQVGTDVVHYSQR
jgi:hypothetical protein